MRQVCPDHYKAGWFHSWRGLRATRNHVFEKDSSDLLPLCGRRYAERRERFEDATIDSGGGVVVDCVECAELMNLSPLQWLARAAGERRRRSSRSSG